MTETADPLYEISDLLQRELWNHVADRPPCHMVMSEIGSLTGQLFISMTMTLRHGCDGAQAEAFINAVDDLYLLIDVIGGLERIDGSLVASNFLRALALSNSLLDMLPRPI